MGTRRFGFGRLFTALVLMASFAAVLATSSPVSAATTSVTIHKAVCSTEASDYFDDCHDNAWSGVPFSIGGTAKSTNGSGVATANVTAGRIRIYEDASYITDGGQFIYCSVESSGRVLFGDHRKGGSIYITVKAGEKVICDWYNLVEPEPQGIGLKLHSYQCPASTSGDIFTKCHKDSKANKGTTFTIEADAGAVAKKTSSAGTFTAAIPTASTGWVWVTITEAAGAVTAKGAFVHCSSDGHPGSGNILGGVTVYDGEVTVQVKDGTTFTCDWYNWT